MLPRAHADHGVGDLAVVRDDEPTLVVEPPAPPGEDERPPAREPRELTDRELAVLAMERRPYRHQGAKEQAVRDELGLSATRYYQVLNALLEDPAAMAREPVLVARLRRLRDARTSAAPR